MSRHLVEHVHSYYFFSNLSIDICFRLRTVLNFHLCRFYYVYMPTTICVAVTIFLIISNLVCPAISIAIILILDLFVLLISTNFGPYKLILYTVVSYVLILLLFVIRLLQTKSFSCFCLSHFWFYFLNCNNIIASIYLKLLAALITFGPAWAPKVRSLIIWFTCSRFVATINPSNSRIKINYLYIQLFYGSILTMK